MENIWKYHDSKIKELEKLYKRIDKQTQNELQKIFDTLHLTNDNLYDIADTKTIKRLRATIDEYRDKDLLKGYFGVLANNLYNRTRIKNSEVLEFLIYGAFIEEYSKIEFRELNIFKEDMSYYYSEGINEVRRERKHPPLFCIIPDSIFLYLLDRESAIGYTWKQYNDIETQNKALNIYRQAIILLSQGIALEIGNNAFQKVLQKGIKDKININGDKITGAVDLELIGLNNYAKIEGIKREDKDAKVRFLAITDEKSTAMCQSMKDMEFYIDKENEFYRMYGETQNELRNYRFKIKGLVLGINLPPIDHHFHWCRSSITYLVK